MLLASKHKTFVYVGNLYSSCHRLNINVHLVFTPVIAGGRHITKSKFVIVRWYFQNWYLNFWKMIDGLRYGAKGTFVSINLVSGVHMVFHFDGRVTI